MLRSKRKSYERTLVEQVKTAPRRIFTYINRRLKKTDDLLVLKTSTNIPVKDNTGRANLFAEHYWSIFSERTTNTDSDYNHEDGTQLLNIQCDETEVLTLLLNLDAHKAPGPDGHHPFVLKNLAQILAKPLTYIFNLSLSTGVVPSEWKLAWIKPFYKGGTNIQ